VTENKIVNLLQDADRTAGRPRPVSVNLAAIRRRARQKRLARLVVPVAAAAVVLVALSIWTAVIRTDRAAGEQEKIAALENEVRVLQARTDVALKLIREMVANEQRQRRLDQLQAELTSIPDPLEEVQKQVEQTAFIIVYQADRMYRELNQRDSAIRAYQRTIELFPQTESAEAARQRLKQIETESRKRIQKEI
jgi:tetratricopeptide (TPR) repeat protein